MKTYYSILFFLLFIVTTPVEAQDDNNTLPVSFSGVVIDIEDNTTVSSHLNKKEWDVRDFVHRTGNYFVNFNNSYRSVNQLYESVVYKTCERYLVKKGLKLAGASYLFDYHESTGRAVYELGAVITGLYVYNYSTNYEFLAADAQIDIEWQLFDTRTRTVVWKKKEKVTSGDVNLSINVTPGSTTAHYHYIDSKAAIDVALYKSMDQFLNDPEFKSLIEDKETDFSDSKPEEPMAISAVVANKDGRAALNEAISNTVTVVVGNGHGSGFFITTNGLLMTCEHVVGGRDVVDVMVSKGVTIKADVVRTNVEYDLALLQLRDANTNPLALGLASKPETGDDVYGIGTPGSLDYSGSLTRGIVSGSRMIETKEYIQTDASVSPGNSGGPLLNARGQVVGVVNAKMIGQGVEGVSFAIPINVALEQLNVSVNK